MGAWGYRTFENDDAVDFLLDLAEGDQDADDPLELLTDVLTLSEDAEDYLEAPDASVALVAAEVVLALLGKGRPDLHESIQTICENVQNFRPGNCVPLAIKVIDRILKEDSELLELWEESEDHQAFLKDTKNLRECLAKVKKG